MATPEELAAAAAAGRDPPWTPGNDAEEGLRPFGAGGPALGRAGGAEFPDETPRTANLRGAFTREELN